MKQGLEELQEQRVTLAAERRRAADERAESRRAAEGLYQVGIALCGSVAGWQHEKRHVQWWL